VRSYLAKSYADILGEFEKLVAATDFSETASEADAT
jgi:hypothetical protein